MQIINFCKRWLLVCLVLVNTCLLLTDAKGGRGGGGRSSSGGRGGYRSSSSYSRPSPSYSRPSPSYSRPSPSYSIPSPSYSRPSPSYSRPSPGYKPAYKPSPRPVPPPQPRKPPAVPSPKPPVMPRPSEPVVARQQAYNPNFREPGLRQPAYNPDYKPAGPPPPYSPAGQPVPNAPAKPSSGNQPSGLQPPAYPGLPNVRPPAYPGLHPSQSSVNRPYPVQPDYPRGFHSQPGVTRPYPVQPGYPGGSHSQPGVNRPYPVQPGYPGGFHSQPGVNRPYPVQPGYPGGFHSQPGVNRPYPVQPGYPGGFHSQPGVNRPYPVQPGYPGSSHSQPGVNRPYPVQPRYPGGFHSQSGLNRPYPVQPASYNPYPGVNRPYPQQTLGGNVWQPHYGMPAPAYMNYGGLPTGTNMYTKPHKKKGFIGSLMSLGKSAHKPGKKNKYYGSYPSPYGAAYMGGGSMGHMGGGGGFLGKHSSSASMNTIFPYMAAKSIRKIHKPKFGFMPIYMPRNHYYHRHHHGHDSDEEIDSEYAELFDVYDDDYVGKCQKPIKKKHSEVKCKATVGETQCDARCEEGYKFSHGIELVSNKCWHVTGIWRPKKNFPDCKPVCDDECQNGGQCIRPNVCKCPPEYRGDKCQFHFLKCDVSLLTKGERVGWVCNHSKNETACKIRCKEPAEFESPPATEYKCTPDGVWKPDTLPHCVVKRDVESIFLDS